MEKVIRCKRIIAAFMTFVVAFTFSVSGTRMKAAQKKDVTYIKDFKLYVIENWRTYDTYDEESESKHARLWFEKQGYKMVEGNLNADASGKLNKEVGVYLGYSTTTNPKEAVTDIAVMNERGNYSESEYKRIIEEQKKMYTDMVTDLKTMLEEYRTNVKNNVMTALQARSFMNRYVDDDTNKKLGDLLMTISDEDLGKLLMQANGQVVLMIEDRLSYACDTGKTTWLDRMAKLGGYKALEKKALKACNNDINKANSVMDKKYKEDAQTLADSWEDIRQHITDVRTKVKEWELDSKSEEETTKFFEENKNNTEVTSFSEKYQILTALGAYEYEDKTLLDYFDQSADTFKGDGIRKLYPLVASLTQGQISAVDQTVSLFTLVMNALGAGAFNDLKSGETKEMLDKADATDIKEAEEVKEKINTELETWRDRTPISIYEGVDREVFGGGVAVTSTAHEFSNGDGKTWADELMSSKTAKGVAIGAAAGSVLFATVALVYTHMVMKEFHSVGEAIFIHYQNKGGGVFKGIKLDDTNWKSLSRSQKNDLFNAGINKKSVIAPKYTRKYHYFRKLQLGFAIASIVLAAADIVATSITLYKYYNRDHLPIPNYMVDLSYNEDKQTSFVNYKSVPDQNGKNGDVNGGGGKQWLALYQTHDENAGKPILAPENGLDFKMYVQYGSADAPKTEGYTPLHMFGTPNTPQNLTFTDGESGWSYNDGKKGIYLFFRRGESIDFSSDTGTSAGGKTTVLLCMLSGFGGIFIGAIAMALIRRKKQVTGDSDSKE